MLKKIALVLLGLNLLTPKPVVAIEPITIGVWCAVFALANILDKDSQERRAKEKLEKEKLEKENCRKAYEAGKAEVEAVKAKVEVESAKKDHEIKKLNAQLEERRRKTNENYQMCLMENKRNSRLGSAGISNVCEEYEKALRSLQDSGR